MVISSIKELDSGVLHIDICAKYSDTNWPDACVREEASSREGALVWVGMSLF